MYHNQEALNDPVKNDGGKPVDQDRGIAGMLQSMGGGQLARDLIKPGHDPKELAMRTYLADENECIDLSMSWHKMKEFGLEEDMQLLLFLMASKNSIQGRARTEFLQGITGLLLDYSGRPKWSGRANGNNHRKPNEEGGDAP